MTNLSINKNIFTLKNTLRLFAGITVNLCGFWLSHTFKLPVRLNSLGTMYAACLLGPTGSILTAIGTILIALFTNRLYAIYFLQTIATGIICGIFYKRKNHEIVELVNCSFILCITAAVLNTPINLLFFMGNTGNLWGDALFDMMTQHRSPIVINGFMAELLVDFPDMILSLFLIGGYLYIAKYYILRSQNNNKEAS